jgi:hypothetical protein
MPPPQQRRPGQTETKRVEPTVLGGSYYVGSEIGRGGFGAVFMGFNQLTGQAVAIKRVSIQGCSVLPPFLTVALLTPHHRFLAARWCLWV